MAEWAQVQSFPADQYSKELFVENAIPQSVGNSWQMYIYPERFTYRLNPPGPGIPGGLRFDQARRCTSGAVGI